jgi:Asp-tRNA(Asn)/Glu-tRNA(Gln) amidotransferase A subunit family amidase
MFRTPHALDFTPARADFLAGKDNPRAFLERCIERTQARNADVRAFVTLGLDAARQAADAATRRYREGRPLSAVDGMPFGVKDIMDTFDLPTQMGHPIYKGWQPAWDAACVHALRSGGAIVVGKTVTTAFASGETNEARNPLDLQRTPGGSSSGSAAAVGDGMVPVALGTQTQGSTLRPASYCGAFGFKPTHNALTMQGVHPISLSHDHLGVIAASLADLWLTTHRIATTSGSPGGPALQGASESLPPARKPARLIVMKGEAWTKEVESGTQAAFEAVLERCRRAGVEIVTRDAQPAYAAFEDDFYGAFIDRSVDITSFEMLHPYAQYHARHPGLLEKRHVARLQSAAGISPQRYDELLEEKRQMKARLAQAMAGCDAIVTLSASGPAPVGHAQTGSRTYQLFASFLQLPAFSLPLLEVDRLPVGVQIVGHAGRDGDLCAIARWLTEAI